MRSKQPLRIRTARFGDIPAMMSIMRDAHARSRYAHLEMNEVLAKSMLMSAIQRHSADIRSGNKLAGSHFVAVADNDGIVDGFILACLQPIYLVGKDLEATDLFFICSERAHGEAAARLLKAMHKWVPEGCIIRQGVTDLVTGAERAGRLLERAGMRMVGTIYEKEKMA